MQPFFERDKLTLYCGDLREALPTLPENSVDVVCTDPPYGYSFMEKDWDHDVPGPEYWRTIARVCKPGALMLAFGGTRTYHRMICAIEDAGWEIRDCLMWLYGQGFPKAADIGKMIDKAKGAVREVVGTKLGQPGYSLANNGRTNEVYGDLHNPAAECAITAPATPEAARWTGWANALKPAWEPIVLAMKPLDGTLAQNAEKWGVAGMNIDAARIGENPGYRYNTDCNGTTFHGKQGERIKQSAEKKGTQVIESTKGRWPANVLLDRDAATQLDDQTGTLTSGSNNVRTKPGDGYHGGIGRAGDSQVAYGDSGGASRFFHQVETSAGRWPANVLLDESAAAMLDGQTGALSVTGRRSERSRNATVEDTTWGTNNHKSREYPGDSGEASRFFYCSKATKKERGPGNNHPTVKPLKLMEYLLTLLSTPDGGVILDPFAGSGTTLLAAQRLGRRCIGVELAEHNCEIIRGRLNVG